MSTYCHGLDKVGPAFLEAEAFCNHITTDVGHKGLDDEDQRNDSQIRQFVCGELRSELGKD